MKRKIIFAAFLSVLLIGSFYVAFAGSKPKEAAPAAGVRTDLAQPVDKEPGKPMKIAIIGYQNNPFWFDIIKGALSSKEALAKKGVTVDWVDAGPTLDIPSGIAAIEAAIAQKYDAIAICALGPGVVPAINKAVDAGIPVATYCTEPPDPGKRLFFIGQDLFGAGKVAGDAMAEAIEEKGKVGIITGYFGVTSHELRRKGFEEAISKYSGIEIVGRWENHDKGDEAYAIARDLITSNPDLSGIYVTAGGPFGAAKAVEDMGMAGKVKIVCFDFVPETMYYVRNGTITATIGQDPVRQTHDAGVLLYNYLIAGQEPPSEIIYVNADVVTKENADIIVGK